MNQKPFRTLFLWVIWAATALVVYVTLYRDTGVWDFLAQDSSRITWLILGLFLLGLLGSFILALLITFENLTAFDAEAQLKQEDGGLKHLKLASGRRAVSRFFLALKAMIDSNGQPDLEALLTVELATYQRTSHSIEVVGNLLITLGLIGTVMGLTLTLTGLTSSLEALGHNQELLLSGLRHAMAGMGTAFYTTLLGAVLGGVLLRVFAQITEHGTESLYDRLMRICLVYCSADLRASLEREVRFLDSELASLGQHIRSLQSACEDSRQAMSLFREEVDQLRQTSEQENVTLSDNIKMRQYNNQMLRHEVKLLQAANKPWWTRLMDILRSRSSD
jgi:hypothetical protein